MVVLRRFRLLIGIAAGSRSSSPSRSTPRRRLPTPGRYISWAPPATATATPGAGPVIPIASAPPVADSGPLGGSDVAAVRASSSS